MFVTNTRPDEIALRQDVSSFKPKSSTLKLRPCALISKPQTLDTNLSTLIHVMARGMRRVPPGSHQGESDSAIACPHSPRQQSSSSSSSTSILLKSDHPLTTHRSHSTVHRELLQTSVSAPLPTSTPHLWFARTLLRSPRRHRKRTADALS